MTESVTDSFVTFAELTLTTADRCSLANCTNNFLIGAVHRTTPINIDSRFNLQKSELLLKDDTNVFLNALLDAL